MGAFGPVSTTSVSEDPNSRFCSRLRTISPDVRYMVKDCAPTGSVGTNVYASLPSVYLTEN